MKCISSIKEISDKKKEREESVCTVGNRLPPKNNRPSNIA